MKKYGCHVVPAGKRLFDPKVNDLERGIKHVQLLQSKVLLGNGKA